MACSDRNTPFEEQERNGDGENVPSVVGLESHDSTLDKQQSDRGNRVDELLENDGEIENILFREKYLQPSDSTTHSGWEGDRGFDGVSSLRERDSHRVDHSIQPVVGDKDCLGNEMVRGKEDERGLDMGRNENDVKTSSGQSRKPGVILLGRGNSFSLGRSEVIVIHHPRNKPLNGTRVSKNHRLISAKDENRLGLGINCSNENNRDSYPLSRIQERGDSESDVIYCESWNEVDQRVMSDISPIPSPSPPPVSNGLSHVNNCDEDDDFDIVVSSTNRVVVDDDLKDLWQKAEAVMTKRSDRVKRILEEFGIGEPGGGGGEEDYSWEDEEEDVAERKKEEEEVWRIIQQGFQV